MYLYELSDSYRRMLIALDAAESDQEREAIMQELMTLDEQISDKGENYARLIQSLDAECESIRKEELRLAARRHALETRSERLKGNLLASMQDVGVDRLDTAIGSWRVRQNPLSIRVTSLQDVPERFLIQQEPKVNSRAILAEYRETGEIFDGVSIERKTSLQFR